MKKHLIRTILAITFLFILPALLIFADSGNTLAPVDGKPTAWISAKAAKTTYFHDLRAVIALPATIDETTVSVTLSFTGENAPADTTAKLSELPLYRTVKAGGTTYTADKDTAVRILTRTGLADGCYTAVTLTITQNGNVLYKASLSAEAIGESADLTLLPWDGSLTDWMAALPDSRSLAEITIPGTHDSGALVNNSLSKCQSLSIADQLTSGVRFLDVRLKLQSGNLNVYHGIISQNMNFNAILADCKAFLAAHPDEVILMTVRDEADSGDAAFAAAISAVINEDPSLWFTANRLPKLGEVRGRIVLLRRYPNSTIGYNCWDGWASDVFTLGNGTKVQDFFELGSNNNTNLESKWNKIVTLSTEAARTDKSLYINFTSGYTNGLLGSLTPNITAVSNYINPKLKEYFATLPQGGYGTYPIDFITPEIASALIATNFPG